MKDTAHSMKEGYFGVAYCPACECRVWLIRTKDGRIRCEWCEARDTAEATLSTPTPASQNNDTPPTTAPFSTEPQK